MCDLIACLLTQTTARFSDYLTVPTINPNTTLKAWPFGGLLRWVGGCWYCVLRAWRDGSTMCLFWLLARCLQLPRTQVLIKIHDVGGVEALPYV
jgi:hypothetical protein